jgi:dihydroorotate dehydrogenase
MNLIPAANLDIKDKFETTLLGYKFSHPIGLSSGINLVGNDSLNLSNLGFELIQIGPLSNQTDKINNYPEMNYRKKSLFIKNMEPTSNIEVSLSHIQNTIEKNIKYKNKNIIFSSDLKISSDSLKTVPYMSDTYFLNIIKTSIYLSDFTTINLSSYENKSILQYRNLAKFKDLLSKVKSEIYYETAYKSILDYEKSNKLENNVTETIGLNYPIKFFKKSRTKILIKLDTDLNKDELRNFYHIIKESNIIDGIIVGGLLHKKGFFISGQESKKVSLDQLKNLYEISKGEIPLISTGGILTGQDVYERLKFGAKMVLIYTPFIINGPFCLEKILKELDSIMTSENIKKIKDIPIKEFH